MLDAVTTSTISCASYVGEATELRKIVQSKKLCKFCRFEFFGILEWCRICYISADCSVFFI